MILTHDFFRCWMLAVLTVSCLQIFMIILVHGRDGFRKDNFQTRTNTNNNDFQYMNYLYNVGNSSHAIKNKNENSTRYTTVQKRHVVEEIQKRHVVEKNMNTIWLTGKQRLTRGAETVGNSYLNVINSSLFLDMIPNDLYKAASAVLLKICPKIKVCNYTVMSDNFNTEVDFRCCLQCDCSSMCHVKKSCCPTVEPIDIPAMDNNTHSSCQYPLLFLNISLKRVVF